MNQTASIPTPAPLSRAVPWRWRQGGFSLSELVVVVLLVALLAAIALPSYRQYVERGHRAEARAALLQAAQWLERAATASGSYPLTATFPSALASTPSGRYAIELLSPPGQALAGTAYLLTARPLGAQTADPCGALTLSHQGERGTSSAHRAAECWGR